MPRSTVKTYREALNAKLKERMKANPRYSMRAFARDIGLSPSYLSQVLNGSRGLTIKKAPDVFKSLAFSAIDIRLFELEMKKEHSRAEKTKSSIQKQIDTTAQSHTARSIAPERFEMMSGWFAMVLLQLFFLKDAPVKSREKFWKFSAERLQVSESVIRETLSVFLEMGLVQEQEKGYEPLHSTIWTNSKVPSQSIRKFHRQMIEQALAAIEMQSMDERSLRSLQIPILKSDIPKISDEVIRFSNMILRKYGRTESADAETIYGINFQVFRLIASTNA
jgi:uncharacterized protein (TIGR02147 family)